MEGSQITPENPTPETTPHDAGSPSTEQRVDEISSVALVGIQEPLCNTQPKGLPNDSVDRTNDSVNTPFGGGDNGQGLETHSLGTRELNEKALANFFEHVHAIPMFSFFHRVSLMQRFQAGIVDEPVLLAITGLAFLLTDMGTHSDQDGTVYIDRAEFLAMQSLEQPSVFTVQTLILVIGHRMFCHCFSRAFALIGLAVRLSLWLQLNVEKKEMCFLAREACHRSMWSLFVLDKMLTGGYRDFLLCPHELMKIQLPCPDRNFELNLPKGEEVLLQRGKDLVEQDPSPWTFYIRIMHLRHEVLQFSKFAASNSPTGSEDVSLQMESMRDRLDNFASAIPHSFRFSQSNLTLRAYSAESWPFLMTHLVLHSSYCILYRLDISGLKESLPKAIIHNLGTDFTTHCVSQCTANALSSAFIFENVVSLPKLRAAMDPWFAVCAYQCARILVFLWYHHTDTLGISGDLLSAKVKYFTEALQRFRCETVFIRYIKQDLQLLAARMLDSESRPHSPSSRVESSRQSQATRLIVSRHSLIGQIGSSDRSEELLLPPRLAHSHGELCSTQNSESGYQSSMRHQGPSQDRNLCLPDTDNNETPVITSMEPNIGAIPDFFHIFSPWQFDDCGWSPETSENTQWNNNFEA